MQNVRYKYFQISKILAVDVCWQLLTLQQRGRAVAQSRFGYSKVQHIWTKNADTKGIEWSSHPGHPHSQSRLLGLRSLGVLGISKGGMPWLESLSTGISCGGCPSDDVSGFAYTNLSPSTIVPNSCFCCLTRRRFWNKNQPAHMQTKARPPTTAPAIVPLGMSELGCGVGVAVGAELARTEGDGCDVGDGTGMLQAGGPLTTRFEVLDC